ncbi:hypothetical protein GHT06_011804 [Daphnia sinensis]|uniref:Uncharacterized protein n=1 Tax=Daphnia sinensis TaxID=1820382 RepID=A0AAD5PUZ8_9CRUS|nr:hypothetical protein GHT06_011804 [Daphnia sinensis]
MNATIRKLPGTKREFPSVKSVIDNRKPASFKPRSSAKPSKDTVQINPGGKIVRIRGLISIKPAQAVKEIAYPATIRPPWNPCTKIEPTPDLFIKPLPGTKKAQGQLRGEPFKARAIPPSHAKPFRPVLSSEIRKSSKQSKPADKSQYPDGLCIRDDEPVGGESDEIEKPFEVPHVECDGIVEEMTAGSADPGSIRREGETVLEEHIGETEKGVVKQPDMASSNLNSNSSEFTATPILFRSAFNGRPPVANRQENVSTTEKPSDKIHQIDIVKETEEKIPEKTNASEENDEENGNESRYKKNATQENDSDESDSDESGSDENDALIDGVGKVDERPSKSSRWRPTRFGSSFRLQPVRRPIDYRHPN